MRPLVAEEARLRIVAHPEFARLVLEPSTARAVALEVVGGAAHLRLDRPATSSLPPVPAAARPWLLAVEERDGGARLALALAPGALARLVESGPGRVVVDLVHGPGAPDPARPEPTAPPPPGPPGDVEPTDRALRVRTGRHPGFERLVAEGPAVSGLELRLEGGRIEVSGPPRSLSPLAAALQRLGSVVGPVTIEGGLLRAELSSGVRVVRQRGRPDQLLLDLHVPPMPRGPAISATKAETTGRPTPTDGRLAAGAALVTGKTAESGSPSPGGCPRTPGSAALCVAVRTTSTTAELSLAVEPRPGAAVLWRAGALWVVLDRPVDGVEAETWASGGEALVRAVRREPHPTATLLRLETRGPVAADAEPSERGWTLRLRPAGDEPAVEPERIVRLADPPALAIDADAGLVVLPAALLGSEVTVLAAKDKLTGVGPRRFVDLEFLDAAQGAAWRAVSDDLRVRRLGDRWLIDRAGGLRLAPLPAEGGRPPLQVAADVAPGGEAASVAASRASARSDPAGGSAPRPPPAPAGATPADGAAAKDARAAPDGPVVEPGRSPSEREEASPTPVVAEPAPPAAPSSTAGAPTVAARAAKPAGHPADEAGHGSNEQPREAPAALESPIGLARLRGGTEPAAGGSLVGLLERRAARDPEARAAIDRRLAREALAQGRAAEALALLGEPAAASDPEAPPPAHPAARALAAVGAILSDRLAAGERLLDDPRFSDDREVAFWRAIAAARRADWPRAAGALAASGRTFQLYPAVLQRRLAPLVGRILVEDGKAAAALAALDLAKGREPEPREAARLALVEGLALLHRGAREGAAAAFRAAAEGGDPVTAVEARYHSARLAQEGEGGSPAALLAELGRQRLFWRDHPTEPDMLADLVELTAAAGRYGEALALVRELLARHPRAARSALLAERRGAWFRAVLEGGGEQPAQALESLRILRAHAELLPDGEAGTALVRAVARRLAAVGLPGVAASVLAEHGLPRSAGAARIEFALEAAELRLQAGDRAGALALLDAEAGSSTAGSAATRARAASLRRAASSTEPANGPAPSVEPAVLARLETAWRQRDWRTVAESGAVLLAGADPLDPVIRRLALRVAVAAAADGRSEAARELVARLGLEADGPEARLVGLLAGRSELAGDPLDVAAAIDGELKALRTGLGLGR